MTNPYRSISTKATPQSEPVIGKPQVKNNAGGYVFQVDDWKRLERFLVLGTEGNTYYCTEHEMTLSNARVVERCLKADGARTVQTIVQISDAGRAPKNDPAIFALAMAAGLGNDETRKLALSALPQVCRIGTHLFHFAAYVEQFRGWGRGLMNAVSDWYLSKSPDKLAYQAVKYQQRDGWSHRDLIRLSHPKTHDEALNAVIRWIVKGETKDSLPPAIIGYEKAKTADRIDVGLIRDYRLTREMLPTEWLNSVDVWQELLPGMPTTALVRNLGKMSQVGLLKPLSSYVTTVTDMLTDADKIKASRIHPIQILSALVTYAHGRGMRGSLKWKVVPQVVEALDVAFYMAFQNVEPTGKRWLLGIDVSGSMTVGNVGGSLLTPNQAAAAIAMVTAATEKNYYIMGFAHEFRDLGITSSTRLQDAMRLTQYRSFGYTDCALPMVWAADNNIEVDAFAVYTDNETWVGNIHPHQALAAYRQKTGINAKLIVNGMTATKFSIADPSDPGMLDVVGFDTSAPAVMADFVRG